MAFDDVRYFTFTTQPAMKVLVVADLGTDDLDALLRRERPCRPASPIDPACRPSPYKVERETRKQFQDRTPALAPRTTRRSSC